jgi:hypothetical protein
MLEREEMTKDEALDLALEALGLDYEPVRERNFCERCGKRLGDYIHTCTPPAAQRTWVGLTDQDIQNIHDTYHKRMGPMEFARAIEARLKELNT